MSYLPTFSEVLKKAALVCFEFWQVVPQPCPDSGEWGGLGRAVLVGLGCPKPRLDSLSLVNVKRMTVLWLGGEGQYSLCDF